MSGPVTLTGTLTCKNQLELDRVSACIKTHIRLTRAEPGCLRFEVLQTADPMVWTVSEHFADSAAFDAHQTRTARSDWARQTAGITRSYKVTGTE